MASTEVKKCLFYEEHNGDTSRIGQIGGNVYCVVQNCIGYDSKALLLNLMRE